MNKLLLLGVLFFAPITLASADLKIAVVDLGKAFDAYYKTKDASTHIEDKKQTFQKEIQDMVSDLQHMQDAAKKLYDQANDQTLAQQARSEAAAALQQKKQDLMNMQNHINEIQTDRSNEIKEEVFRRHKEILEEINKVITDYSGPQGFDLVLDKSSASVVSGAPIVLYNSSKLTDITADIIAQLNKGAPAAGSTPAPAAPAPKPATH